MTVLYTKLSLHSAGPVVRSRSSRPVLTQSRAAAVVLLIYPTYYGTPQHRSTLSSETRASDTSHHPCPSFPLGERARWSVQRHSPTNRGVESLQSFTCQRYSLIKRGPLAFNLIFFQLSKDRTKVNTRYGSYIFCFKAIRQGRHSRIRATFPLLLISNGISGVS